jgi:hypothetical protein
MNLVIGVALVVFAAIGYLYGALRANRVLLSKLNAIHGMPAGPDRQKPERGHIGRWNDAIGQDIRNRLYDVILIPPEPLVGIRYGIMDHAQSAMFEELQDIVFDAMYQTTPASQR